MSDPASLVQRCAGGDQRAWRELVDRYAGFVAAIARAHRLREDLSEEVVQATFAALARRIGTIADDRALSAWLRTTAVREAWRVGKSARRHRTAEHPGDLPAAQESDPLIRIEDHQRLRNALESLGGRCRELLSALALAPEKRSYETVATELGIPIGSIGPTRRRCLAKLLEHFRTGAGEAEDSA
jgi:RNA polymerase sigma factor (sigma-70 family)